MKILRLLLSAVLLHYFSMLKEIFSGGRIFTWAARFFNSFRSLLWSSFDLNKTIFISVILLLLPLAVMFFRREESAATDDDEHGDDDDGFFEFPSMNENGSAQTVQETPRGSPPPPPPPPSRPPPEKSEAHEPKASGREETPPWQPAKAEPRSSNLYPGISDLRGDYFTLGKSDVKSPVGRFTSEQQVAEKTRGPYTPAAPPPSVEPQRKSTLLYPSWSDIHGPDQEHPSWPEVYYSPRISREAHVSKSSEEERNKPYPPPPNLTSRTEGLYPAGNNNRDFLAGYNSAHARPNNGANNSYVEKPSAVSSPVRGLYPGNNNSGGGRGYSSAHARPNGTDADNITASMEKPAAVSSLVRGFHPGNNSGVLGYSSAHGGPINGRFTATVQKPAAVSSKPSKEIKKKPHYSSPDSSMSPTTTDEPAAAKPENAAKSPPSKKGKEAVITENLSSDDYYVKENDEGEDDSIEAMWDAINRSNRNARKKKKLKKSETWEIIPKQRRRENVQRLDSEEVVPSSPLWQQLKKSVTFADAISARLRGGLMRREDSWTREEFNKGIDNFIKAKKDDMRDEMEESKRRKFVNLGREIASEL